MTTATKKNLALAGAVVLLLTGAGYRFHVLRGRSGASPTDVRGGPGPSPPIPSAEADPAGLCEHTIPRGDCPFCTPSLLESRGFCGGHGVPEAICTRCHAGVIPAFKAMGDWCAEHELPESQCVLCNPGLASAPSRTAPMSPVERRTASPAVGCRKHAQRIQLASADVARQAGIATASVVRAPFKDLTHVNAEVVYAADRHAQLAARVTGTVREVPAKLGDHVEAGAVLALVESPALGEAKAELASAVALLELWERNHARELDLVARGVGTQRAVIEADTRRAEVGAELAKAEQRLRSLGLTAEQVAQVRQGGPAATEALLAVRAPFAGVVVARDAVQGEVVEAGRPLVTVADTSVLWALLHVPEALLARVQRGQSIVLSVQALRGEAFAGEITWVSTEVDRRTRTLEARAEIRNSDLRLRANLFGTAQVTLADRGDALLVPREAVQWEGCCNVVFVPEGGSAFMPRKVRLGGATDTHVEVLSGLSDGESVVSVGAFLLKTELLKGSIGAGCCEGEE